MGAGTTGVCYHTWLHRMVLNQESDKDSHGVPVTDKMGNILGVPGAWGHLDSFTVSKLTVKILGQCRIYLEGGAKAS